VSVEKVEEALKAIEFDNVRSVQIIYNMFRLRPRERFLAEPRGEGRRHRTGAAGQRPADRAVQEFDGIRPGDHRQFNREGAVFDKGETFSGVPYEVGLKQSNVSRPCSPERLFTWRLCASCSIRGCDHGDSRASHPNQVDANLQVGPWLP